MNNPEKKVQKHIQEKLQCNVDSALDERIRSDMMTADKRYKNNFPPTKIQILWRILMDKQVIYTTAACLLVTGLVVLACSNNPKPVPTNPWFEKIGPCQHTLTDGSLVTLLADTHIRWQERNDQRGFEHLTGQVQVKVAKGTTPFVVSSVYGNVTALGTEFSLTPIDGKVENQRQQLNLMAVEVQEGSVRVSNTHGQAILKAKQRLTLTKDTPPYDIAQDPNLPVALVKRIQSMVKTLETQDKAVWIANFNSKILFEFVKGKRSFAQIKDIWGGSPEDAERLKQGFQSVKDIAEFQ